MEPGTQQACGECHQGEVIDSSRRETERGLHPSSHQLAFNILFGLKTTSATPPLRQDNWAVYLPPGRSQANAEAPACVRTPALSHRAISHICYAQMWSFLCVQIHNSILSGGWCHYPDKHEIHRYVPNYSPTTHCPSLYHTHTGPCIPSLAWQGSPDCVSS